MSTSQNKKPSYRASRLSKLGPTYPDVNPLDPKLDEVDFEIIFLEGIVDTCPDFIEALCTLGSHYTTKGLIDRGLAADLRLVRLEPEDPVVRYNLVCSYALSGRFDQALEELGRAFDLGYRDLEHLQNDPDLEELRRDEGFGSFIQKHFPTNQITV